MEEPKTNSKQEKQKLVVTVRTSGGGIGGLLVLGGALAAAALIAALTNKINKRRPRTRKSIKRGNNEEGSEGIRSLLAIPSPTAKYECDGRTSKISTTQMITIQSLILEEEKPELRVYGGNETPTSGEHEIVSDYMKMGRCVEFDDYGISKDSVPVGKFEGLSDIDVGLLEQENISKNIGSIEDSLTVEASGVVEEGVESETIHEEEMEAEENPLMQIEEEEDDVGENDKEYVEERGEEGSEGTGDSSMESNAEAIWPVEFIEEEVSLELDETKFQFQNPGEKINKEAREAVKEEEEDVSDEKDNEYSSDDETTGKTMMILNKREPEFMMVDDPILSSSRWRISILPMLVPALLLLLLAHYIATHI